MAVDVRLDSTDDSGNACFEADVFHGDGQVAPNRVRVIVVSGAQGQDAVVRIRSSAVVDEPVVGVVLRSICGQNASRRYDFLTDFPVQTRAAAVPTIIPAVVTVPSTASTPTAEVPMETTGRAPVTVPRPGPVRNTTNAEPVVRAPRPAVVSKTIVTKQPKESPTVPKPAVAKIEAKLETPDNKSRLKLESPAAPEERLVQLKSTNDLLLSPAGDPQKREAAAAAWRELNNLPVENPQEKQRLLALEAESKTLKALLAKNEADFKLRLDKLENNRYDEKWVFSLFGLLLAAVAASAFFWSRSRQRVHANSTDWSRHSEPTKEELRSAVPMSRPAALASQLPPNTLPGPDQDVDVDESLFDDLKKMMPASGMASKPSMPAVLTSVTPVPARSIYTDEFLDIQQHADFFVSLGQYEQAIDVLKKSIHASPDVSPLVYLELLKIYHTLGRQQEFKQQRDAFNRIFNSQIPDFSTFNQEGRALEAYPAVLNSIETEWGTPEVLDLIGDYLFRDTAANAGKPFDLAAYRELVLLYAMAQATVHQANGLLNASRSESRTERISRLQDLELDVSKPTPLDVSAPRETSFTKPMLLMSAEVPLEAPYARTVEPLASGYRPSLDLDLDLNLDFSNSELLAMQEIPALPTAKASVPASDKPELNIDLDLDLDMVAPLSSPMAGQAPITPARPIIDTNMLEFDLFDPKVEAKISPRKS